MQAPRKSKPHDPDKAHLPSFRWKNAKVIFFNATGVKKPKSKVFFGKLSKSTEGMDKTLAKFDPLFKTLNDSVDALKAIQKAQKDYVTLKTNYLKTLKAAFNAPPPDSNADTYKKAVMMLERELKSIDSVIAGEITNRMSAIAGNNALQDQMVNLRNRIRKTIDSAQAIVARDKVDPDLTVPEFNDHMNKAARDISAQLNNIAMLIKKGYDVQLDPPANDLAFLNSWHTGGSARKLPEDASRQDVQTSLILMDTVVESIDRWAERNGI